MAPFYENANRSDFICSTAGYGGMTTCDEVPAYRLDGVECNETLRSLYGVDLWNFTSDISLNSSSSCINWNVYYTDCRPDSENPFQGSISFDNIFLAWIAIFQVTRLLSRLLTLFAAVKRNQCKQIKQRRIKTFHFTHKIEEAKRY